MGRDGPLACGSQGSGVFTPLGLSRNRLLTGPSSGQSQASCGQDHHAAAAAWQPLRGTRHMFGSRALCCGHAGAGEAPRDLRRGVLAWSALLLALPQSRLLQPQQKLPLASACGCLSKGHLGNAVSGPLAQSPCHRASANTAPQSLGMLELGHGWPAVLLVMLHSTRCIPRSAPQGGRVPVPTKHTTAADRGIQAVPVQRL